jgi:hypothetical protein
MISSAVDDRFCFRFGARPRFTDMGCEMRAWDVRGVSGGQAPTPCPLCASQPTGSAIYGSRVNRN